MKGNGEDPVLAFQSESYPASLANDPEAEKRGDHGEKLLRYLLSELPEQAFRVQGEPVSEGSGVSHVIETQSGSVAIHLTWYPAGKECRDTWTIQLWRTGAGLRDMLRGLFGRTEVTGPVVDPVASALARLMQERPQEFSEVRWTTWKALEPQRTRPTKSRDRMRRIATETCDYVASILAPSGLAALGPHLGSCRIPLVLSVSGYNGRTILNLADGAGKDVEWEMDSSDTDTLTASGSIRGTLEEQFAVLQSLSDALKRAGLAHEILGDVQGPGGAETVRWQFNWPPAVPPVEKGR